MPSEVPGRLSATELLPYSDFATDAARAGGLSLGEVGDLVARANSRLLTELGLTVNPLQLSSGSLRVDDVIGLLRLSPRLEMEIAPKYLGTDSTTWREDFFFVAQLSRFGRLLANEQLGTRATAEPTLVNLVSGALVDLYWEHFRRPLRSYRTSAVRDYALVGEYEAERLLFPTAEGFEQRVTSLTRNNPFNGVMYEAARQLLVEVDDAEIRRRLVRMVEHLTPQGQPSRHRPTRVPSRHQRWQPLYELSSQVVDGFGLDLRKDNLNIAPGFVLRASKSWEDLLSRAVRRGLPDANVRGQLGHALGERNGQGFDTTPDLTADFASSRVLVDAKYKGRAQRSSAAVSASDVYEGLAFLRAAGCQRLVLLYPRRFVQGSAPLPVGTTAQFEHITVDDYHIHACEVEARGISARGAYQRFAERVGVAVRDVSRLDVLVAT